MDVVVTGVGVVSAHGVGVDPFWEGVLAGRAPFGESEHPELAGVPTAEVHGFDAAPYLGAKGLRTLDRFTRMAMVAAQEAWTTGGLVLDDAVKAELGLVVGTAYGSFRTIFGFFRDRLEGGPANVTASAFGNTTMVGPPNQMTIKFGLRRLSSTVTTGAASGVDAIGYALTLMRSGRFPRVLVGGVEELGPELLAHLRSLGAGAATVEPFRPGAGFVPGEGAAFLLLETAEAARARDARPLARIAGYGTAFDPGAMRGRPVRAEVAARAVADALADAGADPGDVDLVVASANGTAVDAAEAGALATVFGRAVPTVTPKQVLGEATGASGAFAAAVGALSVHRGLRPSAAGHGAEVGLGGPGDGPPVQVLVDAMSYSGHCAALLLGRA